MTVEAEREDDGGKGGQSVRRKKAENSPTKRLSKGTTTTIVPLKGLEGTSSAPSAAKRKGRPRKSDMGSSPVSNGKAMVPRKRGRKRTLGDDDTDRDMSIGATPLKRGRGRPRRSLPVAEDEDVWMTGTTAAADDGTSILGRSVPRSSPPINLTKGEESNTFLEKSPKERLDDLFEGFGPGTRRELRAGLRLGEELAKRQILVAQAREVGEAAATGRSEDDIFADVSKSAYPKLPTPEDKEEFALAMPLSEETVEYPPLQHAQLPPSPERSDRDEDKMSWKASTPAKVQGPQSPGAISDLDVFNEKVAPTPRRRELQWARERKVISKQIERANESQVVIISDDESGDVSGTLQEDTGQVEVDIWQVEARSADPSPASPVMGDALLKEEVVKPRRSKLPSPWRRDSQIVYSDEATEDQSGLFWQPDPKAKQIAREREERKRRKESLLDVSAMLGINDSSFKGMSTSQILSTNTEIPQPPLVKSVAITNEEEIMNIKSIAEESHNDDESVVEESHTDTESGIEEFQNDDEQQQPTEQTSDGIGDETTFSEDDEQQIEETSDVVSEEDTFTDDDQQQTEETSDILYDEDTFLDEEGQLTEETSDVLYDEDTYPEDDASNSGIVNEDLTSQEYPASNVLVKVLPVHPPKPTSWLGRLSSIASFLLDIKPSPPEEDWTGHHYVLLRAMYQETKTNPTAYPYRPRWGVRFLLGMTIAACGYSLKITKEQLGIVDAFRAKLKEHSLENGGDGKVVWDEAYVAKRLFSLIVGEQMRREEGELEG